VVLLPEAQGGAEWKEFVEQFPVFFVLSFYEGGF
jgi:hypothetical protein